MKRYCSKMSFFKKYDEKTQTLVMQAMLIEKVEEGQVLMRVDD